jgi:LysM repeat protein
MPRSFFNIGNALTAHLNAVYNGSSENSLHAGLRTEMNIFSQRLTSLLAMDRLTQSNFIPNFTQCSVNIIPNTSAGPFGKYIVGKGDSLKSICDEQTGNQITANHLLLWNGLTNDTIKPGQELLMFNPNTPNINIHLHYNDFLENILHPDFFNATVNNTVSTTTVAEQPKQNVIYDKDHPLNLPGKLPGAVTQEPGTTDCFFANLSWCDQYFGGKKSLEDFRNIYKNLYPKSTQTGPSPQQLFALAGSIFDYAGIFSDANIIDAIAQGHPVLTNGYYITDDDGNKQAHSLIIVGLTFDKNNNISFYKIIDPNQEIYWLSAKDMKTNAIVNIIITGLKKTN